MRIGLVLNILDEEYQISIYNGIVSLAEKFGVEIICFQQENSNFFSDDLIGLFPGKKYFNLDGIILLTSVITDNYEINSKDDIRKYWGNIPVISVGQKVEGIPSILIETETSMKNLVDHLVQEHKYRNFLVLSGPQTHHDAIIREKIVVDTLKKYSSEFSDLHYSLKRCMFSETSAIEVMNEFYFDEKGETPDAVICADDNIAIGVYKFFRMNNNNPAVRECAVTGFDDVPQAKFENPSLTTIRQPLKEIGEKAILTIMDLIEKKPVEMEYSISSETIIRKSCGCNPDDKSFSEDSYKQMQYIFVQSENMLRLVNRIGQDLNYSECIESLVNVVSKNMNTLETKDFCILEFDYENKSVPFNNLDKICVNPLYVRRNGKDIVCENKQQHIPFGDFYENFLKLSDKNPTSMVFKSLTSGNEIIGCVLYDTNETVLPFFTSISINIAQALIRIYAMELRKQRSEYLEREVSNRTKELVEANNKRMEVEAEVLKISEIERQRFSNDLHDDICQQLAGISMLCRSYSNQEKPIEKEQMVELAQLIGETLQCTRQYAHNSFPVELETLGMNHSLSNLCNSFETQSGIKCNYVWKLPDDVELSKLQKLNLFRIIQEALHNITKHAHATEVSVLIKQERSKIVVEVSDNGVGIDTETQGKKEGQGLHSMQYRANQIGAVFSIKNNPTAGACVRVSVSI